MLNTAKIMAGWQAGPLVSDFIPVLPCSARVKTINPVRDSMHTLPAAKTTRKLS